MCAPLLRAAVAGAATPYPIESHYAAVGPAAVLTSTATDASGGTDTLFYPADLASGAARPLLTWGNGSSTPTSSYPGVMNHLASWGFVIVASTSVNTGTGQEMLAGVNYMLSQNSNSSSIFYNRIDASKVGALGHSQGAGGTVNATNNSGGLIKADVPICLPDQRYVHSPDQFNVAALRVPTLLLGGNADLIAPPTTLQGYYNQIPGAAALAILKGANHFTIEGSGGGYLGYLTAWFMYNLRGDQYARAAFVGTPPELNINRNWVDAAEKGLP